MASILQRCASRRLISVPHWLPDNTVYETIMGSVAYGVSSDTSDMDVYGFCIPPKGLIFPHLRGEIPGFGRQTQNFEQFQQHHIKDSDAGKEYDITVFSIVKYLSLCMENNPNMIDSLFTPRECVLHSTALAERVRERRKVFLHKGAWFKFKGYAYAQLHKIRDKHLMQFVELSRKYDLPPELAADEVEAEAASPGSTRLRVMDAADFQQYRSITRDAAKAGGFSKRLQTIFEHGYDVKYAYHVVRLINEVRQILVEGDLDLQREREQLKAVRRGEWTLDALTAWFAEQERILEEIYARSALRHGPDEDAIKALLLECLESHYGSLDAAIRVEGREEALLRSIAAILREGGY